MIKKILISLMCSTMAATWQYSKAEDFSLQTDRPMIGQLSAATLAEPPKKEDGAVDVVKLFVKKAPPIRTRQEIAAYFSFEDVKGLFEIARSPLFQLDTGKCDKVVFLVRLLLEGAQENYAWVLENLVLSKSHPFGQSCWDFLYNCGFISPLLHQSLIEKATSSVENVNGKFDLELLPRFLLPEHLSGTGITQRFDKKILTSLTPEERTFLGLWGDSHAQNHIAQGLAEGCYGFAQTPAKLEEYANMGWEEAQTLVSKGLAGGRYGFTRNPENLEKRAREGWKPAQDYIADCIAEERFGFAYDPIKLEEYGNLGWERAQSWTAEGLAYGRYGFTGNPSKLEEYANKGWRFAQSLVVSGLASGKYGFIQDSAKLEVYASKGWEEARLYVAEGFAEGEHGFTQNPVKLEEYANKGWEEAQWHVAEGLFYEDYGFTQDLLKLENYAKAGFERAQFLVSSCLAVGKCGFPKDHVRLEEYANKGWEQAQWIVAEGLSNRIKGFIPNYDRLIAFSEGNLSIRFVQTAYNNFQNETDRLLYALHVAALIFEKQYCFKEKRMNPAYYTQLLHAQQSEGQLSATAFAG